MTPKTKLIVLSSFAAAVGLCSAILGHSPATRAARLPAGQATEPLSATSATTSAKTPSTTTNAAPMNPTTLTPAQATHQAADQLKHLAACASTGDCEFPAPDPRAQYYEISARIGQILTRLQSLAAQDPANDEALAGIARQYITFDEDGVKEDALSLLSSLPTDEQNALAVMDGLQNCDDPDVFSQAVTELARYQDTEISEKIADFLQSQILHGSLFASRAIIATLPKILTAQNVGTFQAVLTQLPPESDRQLLLRKELDSFTQGA